MNVMNKQNYRNLVGKTAFDLLDSQRSSQLQRQRECSYLTIPTVVPPSGFDGSSPITYPWSSLGGEAVSTLNSKLLLTLFPPRIPPIRLELSTMDLRAMAKSIKNEEGKSLDDTLRDAFSKLEQEIPIVFEQSELREPTRKAFDHFIIAGNTCVSLKNQYNVPDLMVYRIDNWVCKRTPSGRLNRIIIREYMDYNDLPEAFMTSVKEQTAGEQRSNGNFVDIYTDCLLESNVESNGKPKWKVRQYLGGSSIETNEVIFSQEDMPYKVFAASIDAGEDYGRGLVELNLGDLRTIESGDQIITEGSAAASKVLYMVSPNGVVKAKDIAGTPNGGFLAGEKDDVSALVTNKMYDFQGLQALLQKKEQAIKQAFQMTSSIQRDAERVTAEEIKIMAAELEKNLGNQYTAISPYQKFIAVFILRALVKSSSLLPPGLSMDTIIPIVSTGFQGLGRSQELDNLRTALSIISAEIPGGVDYIDASGVINRITSLLSVDKTGIIKGSTTVQQEQQARQEAALLQGVAPRVVPELIKQGQPKK